MAPIFHDPDLADDQVVLSYGAYKPWGWHKMEGGDGSNYPKHSGQILDLKEAKASAIQYFYNLIEPTLGDGFAIAFVPSHDPAKHSAGLLALVTRLAANRNRIDASGCLVRTKIIQKLANGGDRSVDVHLNSIAVVNAEFIAGREVLLLDDVTTTGGSLFACRKLLLEAGAQFVQRVAIGRTS